MESISFCRSFDAHGIPPSRFCPQAAPVQISYLAYPGTTGLDAIDYRITDPYLDPPVTTEQKGDGFCEKPLFIKATGAQQTLDRGDRPSSATVDQKRIYYIRLPEQFSQG